MKQALKTHKKPLNQTLTVGSSLLQEKDITNHGLELFNEHFTQSELAAESGMFYELSNKRHMECERYQDCSWFQQDSMKGSLGSKSSLAEPFDPFNDADEFDLPMQITNTQIIPWEDEHLELFNDDILLEKEDKLKEKAKNFENSENGNLYSIYKGGDHYAFDSYNINFSLRKADSFDSMKNISSTNPADIIPISYKEKLNNSNFGITSSGAVKNEIKEEVVESYSPESNSYLMDSDDSDLNIGREEVVEETNPYEVEVLKNCCDSKGQEENIEKPVSVLVKAEHKSEEQASPQKLDLNLDFGKINFEHSLNVNTPDFMDLVEFITEEMRQESTSNANQTSNKNVPLSVISSSTKNVQPENLQENVSKTTQQQQQCLQSTIKSESSDEPSVEQKENSTIDLKEIFNPGVSIAERIKTTTKRNTRRSLKVVDSEDEDYESVDYDDDDDEDYDYSEITRRRCAPIKRRSKSNASESGISSKRAKEEIDSYREKRDKNNEASRRSRLNRKARERYMYKTLEDEEKRNLKLKAEADVLEKQVTSLRQLLLQVVLRKGSGT